MLLTKSPSLLTHTKASLYSLMLTGKLFERAEKISQCAAFCGQHLVLQLLRLTIRIPGAHANFPLQSPRLRIHMVLLHVHTRTELVRPPPLSKHVQ